MRECSGPWSFNAQDAWLPRVLIIAFIAIGARPSLAAEPASLRYRGVMGHAVVVPVHLNGQGPFDLVLDTAARFTTIDRALAAQLHLEPRDPIRVVTLAGSRPAARARLDRVELGPIAMAGVDVLCADMAVLRAADKRIRGVLGQSALAKVSFGIDHARRLVFFEPPARTDAVVALDEREGRPAVGFDPKGEVTALSLVLDSGVPAPVLFQKKGTLLPSPKRAGYFEVETNSGAARLAMADLEGRVGTLVIPRVLAAIQDDVAAEGREEDGLLPTRLFSVVYFDRAHGRLLLKGR